MKVNDLSNTPEFSEQELAEKSEKFLRSAIVLRHKYLLKTIYAYINKCHFTSIQQLKDEILQKQCKLSAMTRQFVLEFKNDFIVDLLKDLYPDSNIYANDPTESPAS